MPLRGRLGLLAGALLVLSTAAAGWLATRSESRAAWVRHTLEVDRELSALLLLVQGAESGQRGYLLTGDEAYLAPWRGARAGVASVADHVAALTSDNLAQEAALAALRPLLDAKLDTLDETIRLRRAGDAAAAAARVAAGRGRELMDQVSARIGAMRDQENRLLATRTEEAEQASDLALAAAAVSGLLALLCVLVWTRRLRADTEALRAANRRALDANEGLVTEMGRREALEEQLRQAQKMEAVGQLTGGIAHDFNNMLAVVMGNLELLGRRAARHGAAGEELARFANRAAEGAKRAAALTQQLLAFSRQQPLRPEPVEANRLVAGMSDLLGRTLGEHVVLETVLAGGLWRCHADRNGLENAVLNLAVNARDAMPPEGGRLTIETANAHLDDRYAAEHIGVPPGQYVLVAVTDTGAGMPPDVQARAFEPFFTTKDQGKGTGLGLSQVYGFLKQSGGHVKIYSEAGQGTTVKLYLPRYLGEGEGAQPEVGSAAQAPAAERASLVLVVEDEEMVRRSSADALLELGYRVLEAEGAAAALRLLDAHPDVDLLFTDVVMPEVNGRKLADAAMGRHPGLRVLFTTGYTRNAVVHNGVLDAGVELLPKPFTLHELGLKLRTVLGKARLPPRASPEA